MCYVAVIVAAGPLVRHHCELRQQRDCSVHCRAIVSHLICFGPLLSPHHSNVIPVMCLVPFFALHIGVRWCQSRRPIEDPTAARQSEELISKGAALNDVCPSPDVNHHGIIWKCRNDVGTRKDEIIHHATRS